MLTPVGVHKANDINVTFVGSFSRRSLPHRIHSKFLVLFLKKYLTPDGVHTSLHADFFHLSFNTDTRLCTLLQVARYCTPLHVTGRDVESRTRRKIPLQNGLLYVYINYYILLLAYSKLLIHHLGPEEAHSFAMGTSGIQHVSFSTLNQAKNGEYDGGESVVSILVWRELLAR
jgi:hypothetical protein